MARRWITSDVPPKQSSRRNFSWSSCVRRDSFFCTLSRTRIVAKLVSRTTSNCGSSQETPCEHRRGRKTESSGVQGCAVRSSPAGWSEEASAKVSYRKIYIPVLPQVTCFLERDSRLKELLDSKQAQNKTLAQTSKEK